MRKRTTTLSATVRATTIRMLITSKVPLIILKATTTKATTIRDTTIKAITTKVTTTKATTTRDTTTKVTTIKVTTIKVTTTRDTTIRDTTTKAILSATTKEGIKKAPIDRTTETISNRELKVGMPAMATTINQAATTTGETTSMKKVITSKTTNTRLPMSPKNSLQKMKLIKLKR